jgi:Kef-type K+ transport system membrane component KefB
MDFTVMRGGSAVHVVLVGFGLALLATGLLWSQSSAQSDELGWLALGLTVVLTAALVGGHLAERFGQATVLGELLAGMVLGSVASFAKLQFIATDPYLDILAQVGMLLLLFEVGLDLSVRDLFEVGPSSLTVALIGTVSSLAVGAGAAALVMRGAPPATHIFMGAALTATSVGITARVLKDLGASRSTEARIVLGAAVVDDVLGLVVLGIVGASFAPRTGLSPDASFAALIMKTVGFLVLAIVLGSRLTPSWFRQAARLRTKGALLAVGLCFCFFLSWAASAIGLAALVGAFAAGLVLEDAHSEVFVRRGERPLNELLQPMTSFLVPVFFVLVGFRADIRIFAHPTALAVPIALTLAAVVGKLLCGVGVFARGASRMTVACGMMPRGEVALVFAALGGAYRVGGAPLLDKNGYTAIVTVVILTTLITPPALKWSFRQRKQTHAISEPAA